MPTDLEDAHGRARAAARPRVRLARAHPAPDRPAQLDPAMAAGVAMGAGVVLTEDQSAVVAHRGGPLLVLAGPGAGKTTTVVETVTARLRHPGGDLTAEQVLVLTFGRRAASHLRDQLAYRLAGGAVPTVATFHSFALALVRAQRDPTSMEPPLRLLTAGEQDARLRELLAGAIADGRLAWPADLQGVTGTRGIAEQVRTLFARARSLGLDGSGLARAGRAAGNEAWIVLGPFLEEYLDTLGFEGALDYGELTLRATVLANHPKHGRALAGRFRLIVVDEFQDTDPAQVALLRGLAAGGADLIVLGDPDQAIYGFRGASIRGILQFPDAFPGPGGGPAPIIVLRGSMRFSAGLARAVAGVRPSATLAPLPAAAQSLHRSPMLHPGVPSTALSVLHFDSTQAEAEGIVDVLLRAHAGVRQPWQARAKEVQPLGWSQMALIVRSPSRHIPRLARALAAAGIPVQQHRGDLPLAGQPAVAALLQVVRAALQHHAASAGEPTGESTGEVAGPCSSPLRSSPDRQPPALSVDLARSLLTGPIGRLTSVEVHSLTRACRALMAAEETAEAAPAAAAASLPGSGEAQGSQATGAARTNWAAGRHPLQYLFTLDASISGLDASPPGLSPSSPGLSPSAAAAARRVLSALEDVRRALAAHATVHEVLWAAWASSDWPNRLAAASLRGGSAGRWADADVDAVLALFDLASRMPSRQRGAAGARSLLAEVAGMQVPVDTDAGLARSDDCVRLISAHRAKGGQWPLVVVASVQEGQWPDLRLRTQLLRAAELGPRGAIQAVGHTDLLVEERRLAYVALTRASQQLVVTAVADPRDGGEQPSRFVSELGVAPVAMPSSQTGGAAARSLTAVGLVSNLRRAIVDSMADPPGSVDPPAPDQAPLAEALARRLGWLAAQQDGRGRALVPHAHPAKWWGVLPATVASDPLFDPAEPVVLSGSMVTAVLACPRRWFLDNRAGAAPARSQEAGIGLLVHWLAQAVGRGELPADEAELNRQVDLVWGDLLGAGDRTADYHQAQLRTRVAEMIRAFLRWSAEHSDRHALAVELGFHVALPGGDLRLRGSIDRIDIDPDGNLHLVDFKTSAQPQSKAEAARNVQLAVYQLALRHGALADTVQVGALADTVQVGALADTVQVGCARIGADGSTPGRVVGAELVYLSNIMARTGLPAVRHQAPLPEEPEWVLAMLSEVAGILRNQDFHARPGEACSTCTHRLGCPMDGPVDGADDAS